MVSSNMRKKIRELPNVTKVQSHVIVMTVFFLSSRSGFLGWFNGLCSFGGGFGVVGGGFCSFGLAGYDLHFHMFCHSKHLKMFSIKYFTVKFFTCKIFYI